VLKLVFLIVFFSLIPVSFAQMDNFAICDELSNENPIIVTTDKQSYDNNDDKMIVSLCMMPDVYHKHIEMAIYDSHGTEVYQIYDPGIPREESFEEELYFFVQEVQLDSFEKDEHYIIQVHASGMFGAAFVWYGFTIEQPIEVGVESQRTDKSFFRTDEIESIIDEPYWSTSIPQDISSDGQTLLLSQSQNLAILNLENRQMKKIDYPKDIEDNSSIQKTMFSPKSFDEIFYTLENDLYKIYEISDNSDILVGHSTTLIENIEDFDITSDNKIIFSTMDNTLTESDKTFSLWISNQDGTNMDILLENHKDIKNFDLSPDDSKIVFTKSSFREPFVDTFVMIYDFETKQFSEIPGLNIYCGGNPKWSPNSELIIYQYANCDRHFPEASLHITDLDGNSGFIAEVDYLETEFIPSHDGVFLYYNIYPNGVYQMILAQPIPEFETIAVLVLALTLVPILLLRKFKNLIGKREEITKKVSIE